MANTVIVSLLSIVLLWMVIAAEGRTTLEQNNEWPTYYPVFDGFDDGICKTMVETQGYTCEEHQVTTEDGYILSLQRIPARRSGKKANKPPVLLQHGILCVSCVNRDIYTHKRRQTCSEELLVLFSYQNWNLIIEDAKTWLLNSPDKSLGFILADNGYDVWLANTRGTKYSSGHTSLTPEEMDYWDWTWDELSNYDLPAFVQYVYSKTGQKLHYAGHSLGTLMALSAFCQGRVLNNLRSAALLSPIAHMNQITSLLIKFAADSFLADDIYWLGLRQFIPNGDAVGKLVKQFCNNLNANCSDILTVLAGPNCCLNSSTVDAFLDHVPQSTSTKNLVHLSQMIRSGTIAKYDYGNSLQNMQHYGQLFPPLYDMTGIPKEFPLFLSYGGEDTLSDVNDVHVLLDDLKDHDGNKLVVLLKEDYAHVDFVLGDNANQVIYDPMMAFFKAN